MTRDEAMAQDIRELNAKIEDDLRHHLANVKTPAEENVIRNGLACIHDLEMECIKRKYDAPMITINL